MDLGQILAQERAKEERRGGESTCGGWLDDNPLSQSYPAHWLGEQEKWQLANTASPVCVSVCLCAVCVLGVCTIGNHEMGRERRWKSVGGPAGRERKSLAGFWKSPPSTDSAYISIVHF